MAESEIIFEVTESLEGGMKPGLWVIPFTRRQTACRS